MICPFVIFLVKSYFGINPVRLLSASDNPLLISDSEMTNVIVHAFTIKVEDEDCVECHNCCVET
jgi:hypothetical protein